MHLNFISKIYIGNEREKYYRLQFSEREYQPAESILKYDCKKNYPGAMAY